MVKRITWRIMDCDLDPIFELNWNCTGPSLLLEGDCSSQELLIWNEKSERVKMPVWFVIVVVFRSYFVLLTVKILRSLGLSSSFVFLE
jgi:hypothetical protein